MNLDNLENRFRRKFRTRHVEFDTTRSTDPTPERTDSTNCLKSGWTESFAAPSNLPCW